jgi:gliding motility-associated-like protein
MRKKYTITILLIAFCYLTNAQITGIKISGDTCTSQTLDLQALGTSSSPYFFWNFDDPASGTNDTITITGLSSPPFPTHTFSSPGIYNVCVTFQEPANPPSTICRRISIGLCCNGIIKTNDSCIENQIPFSLTTNATINSITWNFGDPASGSNVSYALTPAYIYSTIGIYKVTVSVNATCGVFTDTITKNIIRCLPSSSCTGDILFKDSCQNKQSNFQITSSNTINNVQWSFGDPLSGISNTSNLLTPTHTFSNIGNYTIKAIVNFNCGIDTIEKNILIVTCDTTNSANCKIYVPSGFTPNNDNINDFFSAFYNPICSLTEYEMLIFNRWGELIFKSSTINNKWNGRYKNQDCPVGVYCYLINYKFDNQQAQMIKGDITILR